MNRVNVSTLEADYTEVPMNIRDLSDESLRNLQTAIVPVPADLVGYEWWPRVVSIPDYDPLTQKLEGETLVADEAGKFVTATQIVVPYTPEVVYITSMSRTDFKGLFTATEYRAISVMSETDDNLYQFWDMAQTADHVDMADVRTQGGLNYIAAISTTENKLPNADRVAIILLGKLQ